MKSPAAPFSLLTVSKLYTLPTQSSLHIHQVIKETSTEAQDLFLSNWFHLIMAPTCQRYDVDNLGILNLKVHFRERMKILQLMKKTKKNVEVAESTVSFCC